MEVILYNIIQFIGTKDFINLIKSSNCVKKKIEYILSNYSELNTFQFTILKPDKIPKYMFNIISNVNFTESDDLCSDLKKDFKPLKNLRYLNYKFRVPMIKKRPIKNFIDNIKYVQTLQKYEFASNYHYPGEINNEEKVFIMLLIKGGILENKNLEVRMRLGLSVCALSDILNNETRSRDYLEEINIDKFLKSVNDEYLDNVAKKIIEERIKKDYEDATAFIATQRIIKDGRIHGKSL